MAQFDFDRFLASPPRATAPNATMRLAMPRGGDRDSYLSKIREMCLLGQRQSDRAVMVLDGLLPIADALLDAPLSPDEFATERERIASDKPRWQSILQKKELKQLAEVCPGADAVIAFRKTCVGFFLAE